MDFFDSYCPEWQPLNERSERSGWEGSTLAIETIHFAHIRSLSGCHPHPHNISVNPFILSRKVLPRRLPWYIFTVVMFPDFRAGRKGFPERPPHAGYEDKMKTKSILTVAVILAVVCVAVATIPSQYYCGHRVSFHKKIFGPTHCCRSGRSLGNMRQIAMALNMYHEDYGAYPRNASTLVTAGFLSQELPKDIVYNYDSGSYVLVRPHGERIDISYLLKPDGTVRFNGGGTATENDPVLMKM